MITIKTMKQIPTSRVIPSFRSGGSVNRLHSAKADQHRIIAGQVEILSHRAQRQWRNDLWLRRKTILQGLRTGF